MSEIIAVTNATRYALKLSKMKEKVIKKEVIFEFLNKIFSCSFQLLEMVLDCDNTEEVMFVDTGLTMDNVILVYNMLYQNLPEKLESIYIGFFNKNDRKSMFSKKTPITFNGKDKVILAHRFIKTSCDSVIRFEFMSERDYDDFSRFEFRLEVVDDRECIVQGDFVKDFRGDGFVIGENKRIIPNVELFDSSEYCYFGEEKNNV